MSKQKRKGIKGDVSWYLPNQKKPFAYSTTSTKDLVDVFGSEGKTVQEIYDSINYDEEAKTILMVYIDKGYGNEKLFKGEDWK